MISSTNTAKNHRHVIAVRCVTGRSGITGYRVYSADLMGPGGMNRRKAVAMKYANANRNTAASGRNRIAQGSAMGRIVTPFPCLDVGNSGSVHSVPSRYGFLGFGRVCQYFLNLLVGQLRPVMCCPRAIAALLAHVAIVVVARAKAQVRRIHARRVVTTVHDDQAIGDRAVNALISVSVSADRNFTGQQKNAVSIPVFSPMPKPASIAFGVSIVKNILRTKQGKFGKPPRAVHLHVVPAAHLPANGRATAKQTRNSASGLICHALFYHLNSGVCNGL